MLQRLFYARLFLVTIALSYTIYTKEGNVRTSCSQKTLQKWGYVMYDLLVRTTNVNWITRLEGSSELLHMVSSILEQHSVLLNKPEFSNHYQHCIINGLFYNAPCQEALYKCLLLAFRGTDWVITTKAGRTGCSYHWTNWSV